MAVTRFARGAHQRDHVSDVAGVVTDARGVEACARALHLHIRLGRENRVEVRRDGYVYRQTYKHGAPTAPLAKGEKTKETGTTVTFWADGDIFETTHYDFTTLARRFQEMAFLNKGLTIELIDERDVVVVDSDDDVVEGEEQVRAVRYHYDGGISDLPELPEV